MAASWFGGWFCQTDMFTFSASIAKLTQENTLKCWNWLWTSLISCLESKNITFSRITPLYILPKWPDFFRSKNVHLLEWPVRSPDLNIMENIWSMLVDIVYDKKQYENTTDLWEAIRAAADLISSEKVLQVENLYRDITARLIEVIEAKGQTIKRWNTT